ncbi:omptin family outer membrane protease [Erwinia mallotivora]|uniref:omptin family outer membrane protease n=1 Tax=Erwinia mallotivora TaxID=69222 RepID=UPI0021BFE74D|nr:omptin family outer membrane protease [Erwinia mallotivora]
MKTNAALTAVTLFLSCSVQADNNNTFGKIKASAGLSWLSGESGEYVYGDDGNKQSELKWKIKNTAIIKGDLSWDALQWLTLNARGWATVASSGSAMDDYDWQTPGQSHWSDWSTHPNTRLNHANEFDLNVKGWLLNEPTYQLGVMLGYQQTRFSWTAFGGSYNYDNGQDIGEFQRGSRGIGYKQQFSLPYLGLVGLTRYGDIELTAAFKFSPWVRAKDNDEHYQRALSYQERGNNSNYYSATAGAGYYITPAAKVYLELNYSRYEKASASTSVTDRTTGENYALGDDSAGIANKTFAVTSGLQYQF